MAQSTRHQIQRLRIVNIIIPQVVCRFLDKNQDYSTGSDEFGARAQVIDISRKYKKIKSALWDGNTLKGEPLTEVIDDMIGHLLILRELLVENVEGASDATEIVGEFGTLDWARAYALAMQEMERGIPRG